jgi:hypothetical protein
MPQAPTAPSLFFADSLQITRPLPPNVDMHDQLRVTHQRIPDEVQLELLAPWYTQNTSESRTLDFFDAIPKYPFPVTTTITKAERIQSPFTLRRRRYVAEILPTQIKDGETGQERTAGSRTFQVCTRTVVTTSNKLVSWQVGVFIPGCGLRRGDHRLPFVG